MPCVARRAGPGWKCWRSPFLAVISAIAGTIAAAISLSVPRSSLRWSDSFVLLVAASFAVQALAALPPYLLATGDLPDNILLWTLAMSGPIDWNRSDFNLIWACTILTLLLCSPWFRSRFDGCGETMRTLGALLLAFFVSVIIAGIVQNQLAVAFGAGEEFIAVMMLFVLSAIVTTMAFGIALALSRSVAGIDWTALRCWASSW